MKGCWTVVRILFSFSTCLICLYLMMSSRAMIFSAWYFSVCSCWQRRTRENFPGTKLRKAEGSRRGHSSQGERDHLLLILLASWKHGWNCHRYIPVPIVLNTFKCCIFTLFCFKLSVWSWWLDTVMLWVSPSLDILLCFCVGCSTKTGPTQCWHTFIY